MLDVESFAERLAAIYQRLWLIAAAITRDRTEADDIVQDAAMVALRKLDEFAPGTSFAAWMSQIVRLTALNAARKLHRHDTLPTNPQSLDRVAANNNAANTQTQISHDGKIPLGQTEFDDALMRALASVNETARACLLLRTVQQLSYAEIAETLQIPAGTAMSHVHRAREALRSQLLPNTNVKQDLRDPSTPA